MDFQNIRAIFLDVDSTLTPNNSWLKITEGLRADPAIHNQIYDSMIEGRVSYQDAKRQLIDLWRGTQNSHKGYFEDMFSRWEILPSAYEVTRYLNRKYKVCLLSGAVDLWVRHVARELRTNHWYSNTKLIFNSKGELVDFEYWVDQAKKKVEQKNEFLITHSLTNELCIAVGDGANDELLFKETRSILVSPDPGNKLTSIATTRVDRLEDLTNIL